MHLLRLSIFNEAAKYSDTAGKEEKEERKNKRGSRRDVESLKQSPYKSPLQFNVKIHSSENSLKSVNFDDPERNNVPKPSITARSLYTCISSLINSIKWNSYYDEILIGDSSRQDFPEYLNIARSNSSRANILMRLIRQSVTGLEARMKRHIESIAYSLAAFPVPSPVLSPSAKSRMYTCPF